MKSLLAAAEFAVALPVLLPLAPVILCMYLVRWLDGNGSRPRPV